MVLREQPAAWGQHQDPNQQWNAAGYYQGYAQGYDQYGYPTQPPQDPAYAQYGNYPGYGNYPQQVCQFSFLFLPLVF